MNQAGMYQSIDNAAEVKNASAHRLIQMLLEGAIRKTKVARGFMLQDNITQCAENISLSIAIIDSLRASLNKDAGGELAQNLNDLYDYMEMRLLQANLKKDDKALDETIRLLKEIKEGWDGITPSD